MLILRELYAGAGGLWCLSEAADKVPGARQPPAGWDQLPDGDNLLPDGAVQPGHPASQRLHRGHKEKAGYGIRAFGRCGRHFVFGLVHLIRSPPPHCFNSQRSCRSCWISQMIPRLCRRRGRRWRSWRFFCQRYRRKWTTPLRVRSRQELLRRMLWWVDCRCLLVRPSPLLSSRKPARLACNASVCTEMLPNSCFVHWQGRLHTLFKCRPFQDVLQD